MCIVIDTNVLASVFKQSSANHTAFKPVLDWIINGKGKVVYGGSKYKSEIVKYYRLFSELKKINKAIMVKDIDVDHYTMIAESMIAHKNFDDQHIVGLLLASKCKIICSEDKRAYPFFTHDAFFKKSRSKPKIYKGLDSVGLLIDRNISSICRPCVNSSKTQKELFNNLIINNKL